jgi:hypothetical protein
MSLIELRSALQIVQGRRRRFERERRDLFEGTAWHRLYARAGAEQRDAVEAEGERALDVEVIDDQIGELLDLEERIEEAAIKSIEAELEQYEEGQTS